MSIHKAVAALGVVIMAATLAACGGGGAKVSDADASAFEVLAAERRATHATHVAAPSEPTSIEQYVMGNDGGFTGAAYIATGHFTGATSGAGAVLATFQADTVIVGPASSTTITVNVGKVSPAVNADAAMRGAGNVVVFLKENSDGTWSLVDGSYSIAVSDSNGRLSMPLVDLGREGQYLGPVTDVADVQALLIANALISG